MMGNYHPSREVNERQIHQVRLERFDVPQKKKEAPQDPCLPWFHGRNGVHCIGFARDVGHLSSARMPELSHWSETGDKDGRKMPGHFRRTISARFSRIAATRSPGQSRMVDGTLRPPGSNTWFGSGWNRPPVNSATFRSANSLEPKSFISCSYR